MNRESLIAALHRYYSPYKEEEAYVQDFIRLLLHPDAYRRDHLPGHITGSAFIVEWSRTQVLLTQHAKLNKWLQPGGHADGEENILSVALREAREETGLDEFKLLNKEVFDIDIHAIPARDDFPTHLHFDVRFLLEANAKKHLKVTEESHALAWIPMHQLSTVTKDNGSIMRMASKVASTTLS